MLTATTQTRIVALLLLFATLNALLWSFVRVPGSGGPDEKNHFGVVEQMIASGELPRFTPYEPGQFAGGPVRAQVAYELTPNLTAVPVAVVIAMLGSADYEFNVHIARLFMVALYPVTLWYAYLTLRLLFPRRSIAPLWGITVMATVPMFTLVHTYYTNDAPAIAASTIATYALIRAHHSRFATTDTLLLGFSLGLVGLHKYTGFLLFPVTVVTLIWHFYQRPIALIGNTVTVIGIATAIACWWYIRNWTLYGDPFGVGFTQAAVDASGGAPIPPRARGLSPIDFATKTNWMVENFATFWAGYGTQRLKLPGAAYLSLAALTIAAAIGLADQLTRSLWPKRADNTFPVLFILVFLHFGLWMVSFWSSYAVDVALHGRYVFPSFVAFVALVIFGMSVLSRYVPKSSLAAAGTIPIMLAANGAYFMHSILPDVNR